MLNGDQTSRSFATHFRHAHPEYHYRSPVMVCSGCDVVFRQPSAVMQPRGHLPTCAKHMPYTKYTLKQIEERRKVGVLLAADVAVQFPVSRKRAKPSVTAANGDA